MRTTWRKVITDLWQERLRTALVTLAIALGIAGFSAVLSSFAILTRELNTGYLATNPASATLTTDRVDDALVGAVRAVPGVADVETRRVLRGRIRSERGTWRKLWLFVVKDYGDIRISKLVPYRGAWPPGPAEVLLERDALQVAGVQIGDTVLVKTADGKEQPLRLTGSVHDVGLPQARMEHSVYGYVVLATLTRLGEKPYLDQLKIEVADHRFDETHVRTVARRVQEKVQGLGHPVRELDVPKPGRHPHADIMGLLLLLQAAFGLFALLLSGVLVVNLLTALMASQVRQIGVMKAVGATRWQVARVYLAEALLLGAAAIAVGLPVGLWGSRVLSRSLAVFLNFDLTSLAVPLWVYLLECAAGLLVPLLASAYPVFRGSAVTVRQALADVGVTRNTFGTSPLERALAGVGGVARPVLLGVRNSFRRRGRLLRTAVTLSAAGVCFVSALNIRASIVHTLDHLFSSMTYDVNVWLEEPVPFEKAQRAIHDTPGVVRAEGWLTTAATVVGPDGGSGQETGEADKAFGVIGLPPETDLLRPELVEGRGLRRDDTNAIVVNTRLAQGDPRLRVGNEVRLRMGGSATAWRVVGRVRVPFAPAGAYVSQHYLERLRGQPGVTNDLRLVMDTKDRASLAGVMAALENALGQAGVRAAGSNSPVEHRVALDEHMRMIYVFLIIVSGVLAAVGGLGLMTTMSLNVLERRREMAVLRTLGASPPAVCAIVVLEGSVIGILGWALGSLAAWPISRALGNGVMMLMARTDLDFVFAPAGVFVWLAICIGVASAASFVPAWNASRLPIREAIGYE